MKASSPQASELVLNTEQRSFPTTLEHVQLFDEAHWLIADSNQVCKTDDAGKSWKQIYRVDTKDDRSNSIRSLSFIDMQNGFLIVGNDLMRTYDGGISWSTIAEIGSTEDVLIQDIHFTDSQHGWAVGLEWQKEFLKDPKVLQYIGAVFNTEDGGVTWRRQELNTGKYDKPESWSLTSVYFIDVQTGWVAGDGVIFWTTNSGEKWNPSSTNYKDYKHIEFLDNRFGWATQRQGSGFAVTTDGGKTWKFLKGPPAFGSWSASLVFLTPEHGFAVLLSLYETRDGGRSWRWRAGDNRKGEFQYDYVGRARNGALVVLGVSRERIISLVSTDGGLNWQPSNSDLQNIR